ncbi:MAG: hypothetical protein JW797_19295 [Bradymonadales bacterium]|nr:hypothetical protein [Bradymonadales bacterium]
MSRYFYCMIALLAMLSLTCANEPPSGPGPGADALTDQDGGIGDQGDDPADDVLPDTPQDSTPGDQADLTGDIPLDPISDAAWPSCVPTGSEICGNGFDDNCDGQVDEGCSCSPEGGTQYCYPGDPSHLSVPNTTCQPGTQTCHLEFWGDCEDAVGPEPADYCGDLLDNNCNGEIDEGCGVSDPIATCPEDFTGPVLNRYTLTGIYSDPNSIPMATAIWSMLSAPPGHSYDVTTTGLSLTFFADVTGDYHFRLTVENIEGGTDSCETTFTATTEDILRIELTWYLEEEPEGPCPTTDKTDLDLHLRRNPTGDYPYYDSDDNCYWDNCATCQRSYTDLARERFCRDFIDSPPAGLCTEGQPCPPPQLHWGGDDDLFNDPRLDLDDVDGCGPENVNIREPMEGIYRVGVHFYDPYAPSPQQGNPVDATARVRILCQGSEIFLSEGVVLTASGAYLNGNDFWEVGDLTIDYDAEGLPCKFAQFGGPGSRRICDYSVADPGGCPP